MIQLPIHSLGLVSKLSHALTLGRRPCTSETLMKITQAWVNLTLIRSVIVHG